MIIQQRDVGTDIDTRDFLAKLGVAIDERKREWKVPKGKSLSLSFRGNELAGETGELCNVIKKIECTKLGMAGGAADAEALHALHVHAGEEMGDVLICLMLLARKLNIDLETATRRKFNMTSRKLGMETML